MGLLTHVLALASSLSHGTTWLLWTRRFWPFPYCLNLRIGRVLLGRAGCPGQKYAINHFILPSCCVQNWWGVQLFLPLFFSLQYIKHMKVAVQKGASLRQIPQLQTFHWTFHFKIFIIEQKHNWIKNFKIMWTNVDGLNEWIIQPFFGVGVLRSSKSNNLVLTCIVIEFSRNPSRCKRPFTPTNGSQIVDYAK